MAKTVGATSAVLLHGRVTKVVEITRSVWQGCPISPLIFIIVLKALSCMISEALIEGSLRGIKFEEEGLHLTQQFFTDNTTMMIEADLRNVEECQRIFDDFGAVSGLVWDWKQTTAVYISNEPLLPEFFS